MAGPDTHNAAVQASAYSLIKLLHEVYPEIGCLPCLPLSSGSVAVAAQSSAADERLELHQLTLRAQGSLLGYLQFLIVSTQSVPSSDEKATLLGNSCISATVQLLDAIEALDESILPRKDKGRIFQQVLVIASTYPGGQWGENSEHWSINRRYNSQTKQDEQSMTSPAETLNLVSRALLDKKRYLSVDQDAAEGDLVFRIETFYTHMLSLKQQVEEGNFQKCAAGLQHDLLYLLNHAYLDKPIESNGQPISLLMDMESFLLETISLFIAQQLSNHTASGGLMLEWMRWQADTSASELCPLVLWFRKEFPTVTPVEPDAGWKDACTKYTAALCETFGLNPVRCPIAAFVNEIASVPIRPTNVVTLLFAELVAMPSLLVQDTSQVLEGSLQQLFHLRSEVLRRFKEFRPETVQWYARNSEAVRNLYSAVTCVVSLYRYRGVTALLIGAEDTEFLRAREALEAFLLTYFNAYTLEAVFSSQAEFEEVRGHFRSAERVFLTSPHTDFITNFFASVEWAAQWNGACAKLQALRPDGVTCHPFALTDEAIEAWRRESSDVLADGTPIVDLTPYAINRLLLHGLLVEPAQWTPLYCANLLLVTEWLSSPSEVGEPLTLKTLKQAYPGFLLANLMFMALIANPDVSDGLKQRCFQRVQGLASGFDLWCCISWLNATLHDSDLGPEDRAQIWTVIQGRLSILIKHGDQLIDLFRLSLQQLGEVQRAQILIALEQRLSTFIEHGDQLIDLFTLPTQQLSEGMRTQILIALEQRLDTLIEHGGFLLELFRLSPQQLSEAQRGQIWAVLNKRLGTLIEHEGQLIDLFRLSPQQLNEAQRAQIWTVVEPRFAELTLNGYQLIDLFRLSSQQVSEAQRAQIWTTVERRLAKLICTGHQLIDLFRLSSHQLSESQRAQIWSVVESRLAELIRSGHQLIELFRLSPQQLSKTQRTQIWTVVEWQLGALIEDGGQLFDFCQLSPQQLSDTQRIQIWAAVERRLDTLIDESEVDLWFTLSPMQLTETQSQAIAQAFPGKVRATCSLERGNSSRFFQPHASQNYNSDSPVLFGPLSEPFFPVNLFD